MLVIYEFRGSPRPNKEWFGDDPCKGFPTTKGQSLVFGLPGNWSHDMLDELETMWIATSGTTKK